MFCVVIRITDGKNLAGAQPARDHGFVRCWMRTAGTRPRLSIWCRLCVFGIVRPKTCRGVVTFATLYARLYALTITGVRCDLLKIALRSAPNPRQMLFKVQLHRWQRCCRQALKSGTG
ncbi:hypothetical protein KCP73_18640 [Salmonella enterica subsp. enterica]|nr:hypothetical protein KCP73_18640 [Salmonella enterica subsp. enterica]